MMVNILADIRRDRTRNFPTEASYSSDEEAKVQLIGYYKLHKSSFALPLNICCGIMSARKIKSFGRTCTTILSFDIKFRGKNSSEKSNRLARTVYSR